MELTGLEQRLLQEALLASLPRRSDLAQLVRHSLDENLVEISEAPTLGDVVFDLIEWTIAHGKQAPLIEAAVIKRPSNRKIQDFVEVLRSNYSENPEVLKIIDMHEAALADFAAPVTTTFRKNWLWAAVAVGAVATLMLMIGSFFGRPQFPADKVVIVLADFTGPDPETYHVTETVWETMTFALREYDDVQLVRLHRAIDSDLSEDARREWQSRNASILIWGWYTKTKEVVPLSVHFEVLRPPKGLPDINSTATGVVQVVDLAELERFTLQSNLSNRLAYLGLCVAGVARYAANDWDGAIPRFTAALSQTLTSPSDLDQSMIYLYRGSAYYSKQDYDQAIDDFDQAIQLRPDFPEAYNNRGLTHADKGHDDRAIVDYDQAIQLQPDYPTAYNNRGAAYVRKGTYDRAITEFDQAIRLRPDYSIAYNNRGAAYARTGAIDRATADYDRAIQFGHNLPEAYYNWGLAYARKGAFERAIPYFDQAIRLRPDYSLAYNNRGVAYAHKGAMDPAIEDFNEAIHLKPDLPEAYTNRGNAYAYKGDVDRAIAEYDQAIRLRPNDPEIYVNRGLAHQFKGEKDQAIIDFRKVLELNNHTLAEQKARDQLQELGASP